MFRIARFLGLPTWLIVQLLAILLALLPLANITWIAATTGANNPSNDYLRMIGVVDQILAGDYNWLNYFRDTLQNNIHSYAFLFLVRLVIIRLTHWSMYAEIYLGIALATLKLAMLVILLHGRQAGKTKSWSGGIWLLPLLSGLVFSTSQISTFTFGETALQSGLIQCAILAGMLALSSRASEQVRILTIISSGILASWSGGGGLMAWPVYLVGLLLLKDRKLNITIAWLIGAVISALPYLLYGAPTAWISFNSTRFGLMLTALGYPFANQIGVGGLLQHQGALVVGMLGAGLAAIGIYLSAHPSSSASRPAALPAWLLICWGIFNVVQTVLSRFYLAPWYTTAFMPFWFGLVGLAHYFIHHPTNNPVGLPDQPGRLPIGWRTIQVGWSGACLFVIGTSYFITNLDYRDKSFYLDSRSPASAACLRNYRTAPTYCEGLVFQWGVGNPTYLADLAYPLEKHSLAIFAPRQQWTLQGDFVLDAVSVLETPGVPGISWYDEKTRQPAPWSDYHHLNLLLHAPNQIAWGLDLPGGVEQAVFRTSLALDQSLPASGADGVRFRLLVQEEGGEPELVLKIRLTPREKEWQDIEYSLSDYKGQTVKLILAADPRGNTQGDRLLLRYPRLDLKLSPKAQHRNNTVAPSNTDLSPRFPRISSDSVRLEPPGGDNWQALGVNLLTNSSSSERSASSGVEVNQAFEYSQTLEICLHDFSHFFVRMSAGEDQKPLALQVHYKLVDQRDFEEWASFWIPLLADGKSHRYGYDLKLIQADQDARITGLRLVPGQQSGASGNRRVMIEEVGFIANGGPRFCASFP